MCDTAEEHEPFDIGLISADVSVSADHDLEAVVVTCERADVELVLNPNAAISLALAIIGSVARLRGYDAQLWRLQVKDGPCG